MNGLDTTDPWTLTVIIGLTVVSVVSRCFFFMSSKPWQLPNWLQRGLQYAPIAALSAVIVPEIVMTQGQLISSWQDAKLIAALVGVAYYFLRKGVLGTIVAGMLVYLPLHLGLGW
jgi:branched-subunit amino acid transport protein